MPKRAKRFLCECGDAHFYFKWKREYTERELRQAFKQKTEEYQHNVFPGLVLRGEDGQCYRPELTIALVPTEDNYA